MFLSGLEMDSSMELLSVQVSQFFRLLEYKLGIQQVFGSLFILFQNGTKTNS